MKTNKRAKDIRERERIKVYLAKEREGISNIKVHMVWYDWWTGCNDCIALEASMTLEIEEIKLWKIT